MMGQQQGEWGRNKWAATKPNQGLRNVLKRIVRLVISRLRRKRASFLAVVWFIQIYSCTVINGGGCSGEGGG